MKNVTFIMILALAIAATMLLAKTPAQQNDSAEIQLGTALHQEEVEGDLEAAIQTYRKVLAEYPDNRPIAARALLRIGQCYERLGKDEARKAYEQLIRDYADQSEQAKLARARLVALGKPAVAGQEGKLVTRQVWSTPDMGNIEGAPSPDGRYLSFVDWETGDLAIRDLEKGTNRRLTNKGSWGKSDEFAMFSRWSPDGRRIAYDWYDGKCCMDLHMIDLEGGKPRVLLDNEHGEWIQTYDWSPDGKQILILLQKEDGTNQIALVSAANGATRVIKSGFYPDNMRFSRDGQYIAYDRPQEEDSAEDDIFLVKADGSSEVELVVHPADDSLFGWPPDGKGILFASDRTGSRDMWFLPVSAGKAQGAPILIKGGVERSVPFGFTRDGSFFYVQGQWRLDIYDALIDFKGGTVLKPPEIAIKRNEGKNSWPDYSPDGKYLAYVTTRRRTFQSAIRPNILSIRSLETGKEREFITEFKRLAGTRWAPDGRSLFLGAWDNEGSGIYRVNIQNGQFTPIVRAKFILFRHEISPDGNVFVYGRRDDPKEPHRVVSRNLTTGEEKQLYEGERVMFSISPDGQRLAFVNVDKKKTLRVMPIGGGEPRELLQFEGAGQYASSIEWTADGRYILFPRLQPIKNKPEFVMWRIPVEGGEPQPLNLVMAYFQEFRVHPDGQHIVFDSSGVTMKFPGVWVMQNYLPPDAHASK